VNRRESFQQGIKHGVPIALGYFAVSFTFGMMAVSSGISIWEAVLISVTNVTSAGQFAGLSIITASGSYIEVVLTQLVINLRYSLMSFSMSQKMRRDESWLHRYLVAYGMTDEIFGISASQPGKVSAFYNYGAMCVAIPGWVLGTFLGAVSGNLLPEFIVSALSIAIYGMFLAIIIPPAKKNRTVLFVVVAAMLVSTLFTVLPGLKQVSAGFVIIITTVLVAGVAAFLRPVAEEEVANES
jgi:4-azaleucine resistance transporter AzlC